MSTQLALIDNITTTVATQVRGFVTQGSLHLPANYSAENALKAAMLMLPDIKNKNSVPVLESCTRESIEGAFLSMCVQGLNPDKEQCYFIPYGERLTLSRSHFGDIAVAKQVDSQIVDVYPASVFMGDSFEYTIKRGVIVDVLHSQKLENKDNPIVAAYVTIFYRDGREISTVMTIEQIKQAWKQSPTNPVNADGSIKPDSTHGKYPEEMTKKTVVHRACKPIIDSSDDSNLIVQYARQTRTDADDAEVEAEISENANSIPFDAEPIDIDPATGEVLDVAPVEDKEPF